MIVRVNVVLKGTLVVDSFGRFDNLAVVIFRVEVSCITTLTHVASSNASLLE